MKAVLFLVIAAATVVSAQHYQDYGAEDNDYYNEQDNLYQDYEQHREMKAVGAGGGR
jgi:hypothetical protein